MRGFVLKVNNCLFGHHCVIKIYTGANTDKHVP